MLAADLASFLHPVEEGSVGCLSNKRAAKGHIFKAFGIVIRIDTAQGFVEDINKTLKFRRLFFKFDDPLMGAAVVAIKINGGGSIIADYSAGLLAGFVQRPLGIVDDHLF